MKDDPFGFTKAIQIDHLSEEELATIEKILENFK
jgi:hypothetical protein